MIKTICYGTEKNFTSLTDAIQFYTICFYGCDNGSSESERYFTILMQLMSGKTYCIDTI